MRFQPHSLLVLALPFWSSFPTIARGSDVCEGIATKNKCNKKKDENKKVCIFDKKKKEKDKSCHFVKKKPPKVDKVCADYDNETDCLFIGLTPCAWDIPSGTCRHVCTTHEDAKKCKKFDIEEKKVCEWDNADKSCDVKKPKEPKVDKVCADYDNETDCLFIGLTPCAWDIPSGTCRHVCTTHEDAKKCKKFDIEEKKVCKWDNSDKSCDVKKPKPEVDKVCADYDNATDCLFTGGTPCAWDIPSETCRHVCTTHEDAQTCKTFDIEEKKVCEWDNADKSCDVKKPKPEVDVDCADYDNTTDCLFIGGTSCSWDIPSETCRHVCYSLEDARTCKTFDIEGKRVCKFGKAKNPCFGCHLKTECET